MESKVVNVSLFLVICIILVACGPSEAERNAQATAIAASIFATQTSQAPIPTSTPTKTPTPTSTVTPTRTRTPTRAPSPTPSMKTYSNAKWGYSIQYPANWIVEEEQVYTAFNNIDEPETWAFVTVYYTARGEKALIDDAVASEKERGSLKEVVSEGTRTFNGVTWRYAIIATHSSTFLDLYAWIDAAGRAYMFFGSSNDANHDKQTQIYLQMMESFR